MTNIYVISYIHTDKPEYSEVLGVYDNKKKAINNLLNFANYREKNGKLTQYMKPTDEYKSLKDLYDIIEKNMELKDIDIYRITKHILV